MGQSAIGLHEIQRHISQLADNLVDVASQHRREIRVHDGRFAAGHEPHEWTDLVARRNLFEARLTRKSRQHRLGLGVLPGMQQRNRDGLETFALSSAQHGEHGLFVQHRERPPFDIDAPTHLVDGRVQRLGFANA